MWENCQKIQSYIKTMKQIVVHLFGLNEYAAPILNGTQPFDQVFNAIMKTNNQHSVETIQYS